jgi:menaquinol-cytochrome c reductase iron-sulfur subunit
MLQKELVLNPPDTNRRSFLLAAVYTFPFLIAGTFMASIGTYLFGKSKSEPDSWADAGDIGDLQKNEPRRVSFDRSVVDGWKVQTEKAGAWVVLNDRKELVAFSPLCTHLGCAYQWQVNKKAFTCPCHGSVFDIRGDVVAGPAGRPLDRYQVKVEGNRLWLGPLQKQLGA